MNNLFGMAALWLFAAHILTWVQLNGQFKWDWFKDNETLVVLIFSCPVAWLFLQYQKTAYVVFDGSLWTLRLLGFSGGIIVFLFMTWSVMGELPNMKNLICLALAFCIIGIQVFIK
tara:strand:- start:1438 stop:1785 length:348 start_codon:yes stop_codon:yes gene_type:complete